MSKPRKTMAELSAASRSDHKPVQHATVGHAAVGQAALDHAALDHGPVGHVAVGHGPIDHLALDHVSRHDATQLIATKRVRGRIGADGKRTVTRREKPHTSVYMHPAAMRTLRAIAVAEDCKPHDVLLEGLRMVFARFGYDFDQLDNG